MGDAIAFTVDIAAFSSTFNTRNRTTTPLCLLHVDRRRSDRQLWERVLAELLEVRPLQFVSQLERTRYEYRLSLHKCSNELILLFPSMLHVPRVQNTVVDPFPHVGTFKFVKMEKGTQSIVTPHSLAVSSGLVRLVLVTVALVGVCALLLATLKTKIPIFWEAWAGLQSLVPTTVRPQARLIMETAKERKESSSPSISATTVELPWREIVFDDFDDEDQYEGRVAKELLMAELPDFNDELGWRDFFDSQIYQRDDCEQKHETPEAAGVVRHHRKIIARSSHSIEKKTLDRSTYSAAPHAVKPIHTAAIEARTDPTRAHHTQVFTSQAASTSRSPLGMHRHNIDHERSNSSATTESDVSIAQPSCTVRPSTPSDDFGEFWQM